MLLTNWIFALYIEYLSLIVSDYLRYKRHSLESGKEHCIYNHWLLSFFTS